MDHNDLGRVPDGTGLSQAEPANGLGPSGFDPSRGLCAVSEREAGYIEGLAAGVDGMLYLLTGDSFSGKSYDPATVDRRQAVIYSYAFDLKNGGRRHPLADFASVDEIVTLMLREGADWIKQEYEMVERDSDGSPKGGDSATGSVEDDSAAPKGIAQ